MSIKKISKKHPDFFQFTEENIIAKRTGGVGISPIKLASIIGKKSHKNYKKNEVISID